MSSPELALLDSDPAVEQSGRRQLRHDNANYGNREGQLLCGKWHLNRLLGTGGVASVYAATHRNGHRAAIKILHSQYASLPAVRRRFLQEAYTVNRVPHDGVVTIRDECVLRDGTVFLVMDLLAGKTLEAHVAQTGPCPPELALKIADEVLDTLAVAHSVGIVHRDIKPDNIFLTSEGKAKILDFGIAWRADVLSTQTAEQGTMLGTPAFMPPEQACCDWGGIDGRSDIWALGATLYYLLSGKYVRNSPHLNEVIAAAMTRPAPSIKTELPGLRDDVADIIDRALAFDKNGRFPDARAMQSAVRDALLALEASDDRPTLPSARSELVSEARNKPELVATINDKDSAPTAFEAADPNTAPLMVATKTQGGSAAKKTAGRGGWGRTALVATEASMVLALVIGGVSSSLPVTASVEGIRDAVESGVQTTAVKLSEIALEMREMWKEL